MEFHVAGYVYTLLIQGRGCSSSFRDRTIYLGEDVPRGRRREMLLHELTEAWLWHVPQPRTREEIAVLNSTIADNALRDLARQGGIAALRAMRAAPEPRELRYVPAEEVA